MSGHPETHEADDSHNKVPAQHGPASSPGQLVIEWGGSALDEVDQAFVSSVLETAFTASGDPRLTRHAVWLLSASFVGDEEMAALNTEFRGVAGSTDVLSFPQLDGDEDAFFAADGAHAERSLWAIPLVLGDVVISLPRARSQAEEYGHSLQREVGFLLVHSALHLLGHDHQGDEEGRVMRLEEERILQLLSLPRDG